MRSIMNFLILSTISFIFILIILIAVSYQFKGKQLPFQETIARYMGKIPDTVAVTDTVPSLAQLKALDFTKRENELDEREGEITEEEQRLAFQRDSLSQVRRELELLITQREQGTQERIQKLAKIYDSMRPETAAPILEQLDEQIIVQIMSEMQERQVAKVLAEIDPITAADIIQRLSVLR